MIPSPRAAVQRSAFSVQRKGREALFVKREAQYASRDTLHAIRYTFSLDKACLESLEDI